MDEVWLTPGEGGLLLSADGRVQVEVPPGAVSRRTLLRYLPQPPVGETPAWLTMFFGLEAQDEQGAAVTQFESLVSLTYRFPPGVALTETMRLYQWVDATGAWQALDSQMDVPGRQLTADLAGVGLFGLGVPTSFSYGAQHLPTVHRFVTDEWSGNSSLSYPLALPPGPGGLGLNLSLSYASEGVNSIRQGPQSLDGDKAITFNRQGQFRWLGVVLERPGTGDDGAGARWDPGQGIPGVCGRRVRAEANDGWLANGAAELRAHCARGEHR